MKAKMYSKLRRGDMIFISIVDDTNSTIFKGAANINDKKAMRTLIEDVNNKGINLKKEIDWWD